MGNKSNVQIRNYLHSFIALVLSLFILQSNAIIVNAEETKVENAIETSVQTSENFEVKEIENNADQVTEESNPAYEEFDESVSDKAGESSSISNGVDEETSEDIKNDDLESESNTYVESQDSALESQKDTVKESDNDQKEKTDEDSNTNPDEKSSEVSDENTSEKQKINPDDETSEKSKEDNIESEEKITPENKIITKSSPGETATGAPSTPPKEDEINVDRLYGQNRYKNAAVISQAGWTASDKVYLVNGSKFTDALTGAPLASMNKAPILLTKLDALPEETLNEIKRLNANEVVILGGTLSIGNNVYNTLIDNGFNVTRIAGQNRYEQAALVADEIMEVEGENRDAILVSGEVFSDALSISSVAATSRLPIFLTRPNELHQVVIDAIPRVNSWTIIGGPLSVSYEVEAKLNALGGKSKRIGGQNRYEVNRNVLQYYGTGDHLYITSGEIFTDTLPASVLAAKNKSGILLIKENDTTISEQHDFAVDKQKVKDFTVIGGPLTVSKQTIEDFKEPTIVIYLDPGHGGNESGAAYDGVIEKDINLTVSFKIRDLLVNRGYEVAMSRTTDETIGLYERAAEANAIKADLYISVHHNAMPGANGPSVSGIETYYYRYHDEDSYKPKNKGSNTYKQAIDQQRADESYKLASAIHDELIDDTKVNDRGVREMGFAVIRETTMPAVLLELGFMSNKAELEKLTTNSYQNTLAKSVADGVDRYFT